jgi:hypothetical protein
MHPREVNVAWFIGRGSTWLKLSLLIAFVPSVFIYFFKFPTAKEIVLIIGAALLLGLFAVICAIVAIRYFNPWYSWLWWVPPILPLFALLEPLRTGEILILHFIHVMGLAGVFVFIALHAYQRRRDSAAK